MKIFLTLESIFSSLMAKAKSFMRIAIKQSFEREAVTQFTKTFIIAILKASLKQMQKKPKTSTQLANSDQTSE